MWAPWRTHKAIFCILSIHVCEENAKAQTQTQNKSQTQTQTQTESAILHHHMASMRRSEMPLDIARITHRICHFTSSGGLHEAL